MSKDNFHLVLVAFIFVGGLAFVVGDATGSNMLFWGGLIAGLASLFTDIGLMWVSLFK